MKVLHVFPSPHAGGSELCALETIEALNEAGIENYALFPGRADMNERVRPFVKDAAVISYDWWLSNPEWSHIFKWTMFKGFLISAWRIRKYIRKNNIDAVLTHTMAIPAAAIAARISNTPHLWYIHEYGDLDHLLHFNYGKRRMLSFINACSDKILLNSETLIRHFKSFFDSDKMVLLYNAVLCPLRKPIHIKTAGQLTICMIGRLGEAKNQMLALEALTLLKKEQIEPLLYLVGGANEPYKKSLEAYIQLHDLTGQVHITGHTTTPWEFMYKSDCVLVCSHYEAFGRVTVEAMKSGVVPVVSDGGAGKELIQDGVTGFLFESDNAQALAAVLKNVWNADDVSAVTENAFAYAKHHFNKNIHQAVITSVIKKIG